MYTYYLRYYLHSTKKRWLAILVIITLGILITKDNIICNLISNSHTNIILIQDYFFDILKEGLFVCLIIPLCFYILISDLVMMDYRSDIAQMLVSRIDNKLNYVKCKLWTLFVASNLFVILLFILIFILGLYFGFSTKGISTHILFDPKFHLTLTKALLFKYLLMFLMLFGLGLILSNISLISATSYHSLVLLILSILFSQYTVFSNRLLAKLDYFSQTILSFHSPFFFKEVTTDKFNSLINFTITKSLYYYEIIILINIILFLVLCSTRNYEIGDKNV